MKRTLILTILLAMVGSTPALADFVPPQRILEFAPAPYTAGQWHYNGAGILSFDQDILVNSALNSNYDTLVGARVYLPTFQIGGIPGGDYTLTPLGTPEIRVTSADGSVLYMKGTLGVGDLGTMGTVAGGYTKFQADITDVFITLEGAALGSAALAILQNMGMPALDFDLSFQGGSGPGYWSFADMLDRGGVGSGGFSGAMSVPEPTTAVLLALSGLGLLRKRRC